MLRCADNHFYTGYTVDLKHRLHQHQLGKASKYTRGRLPVEYVYWEIFLNKSEALKREIAVKKLSRRKKEELIESFSCTDSELTIHEYNTSSSGNNIVKE